MAFDSTTSFTGSRWLAAANVLDHSVSMFEASAEGALTAVGPPVATGAEPRAVAFSPSDRLLAVANSADNTVSMFRVGSGTGALTPIGTPAPTGESPRALAFSPNGRMLATANRWDDSVSVFKVSAVGVLTAVDGSPVATDASPDDVAFSPDGKLLATANSGSGTLSIFSATNGGELSLVGSTPTVDSPQGMAFSPDGGLLAAGTGTSISVFSVSTTGGLASSGEPTPTDAVVTSLAFSPRGGLLAATSGRDGTLSTFSVSSSGALGAIALPAPSRPGATSVAFDPAGRLLATANSSDDSVSTFSVSAGGALIPIGLPAPAGNSPCAVQFSPAGGLLATSAAGNATVSGGDLSMFLVPADGRPKFLGSRPLGGRPCGLAFSPDGALLAISNTESASISMFSVAPDGSLTFVGDTRVGGGLGTNAVAFSPQGDLLAAVSASDSSVWTFSVSAEGALTPAGSAPTGARPVSVAFRPDGRVLVTANRLSDSLAAFSVSAAGALTEVGAATPTSGSPQSLAFSPTGGLLAATDDKSVWMFAVSDVGVLTAVGRPTFFDRGIDGAVAFSPTGKLIAVTTDDLNSDDNLLWLFRVAPSGALTRVGAPTPTERAPSLAVSPDGKFIATADVDTHTVSIYPLAAPWLDVTVTAGPPRATSKTSATFEFEANYPATVDCRLDAGPFAPCSTSASNEYSGLADGVHTFTVRATDLSGGVELAPTSRSWTIDSTAPVGASLAQPADGASNQRASTMFEWLETTDNVTGVDRYELWIDGALSRSLAPRSCDGTCSATPAEPLADGPHRWQVRAVDGLGNVGVSMSRSFNVDAAPPGEFAAAAPANDTVTTSRRPELSWEPALDGGIGLRGYEVVLDDHSASGLAAGATSFTPAGDLDDGEHRWRVVARDRYGNERTSPTQRFIVDTTPPVAVITAAPNPALAGRNITFSAGESSDSASGIARFDWDLDGDGSFETDTGAERTAVRSYAEPGTYAVSVRVRDRAGLSAIARTDQRVTTTAPSSPHGISINDGARYTRSPKVTITSTWPLFASQMLVSNDGGFATAATLPLGKQTSWTLDSSGAERSSRLVYVRFRRGQTTSETYIDDIILDESGPSVTAASVSVAKGAVLPVLRMRARDRGLAGVASVQVTNNRRNPLAKFRAYRANLRLVNQPGYRRVTVRRALFVRVRDRAGNVSAWRAVSRANRG